MKRRKLGTQGLEVAEIGLGCMGMSQMYGAFDDAQSIVTIQAAIDLGVDLFDTAEVYGPYNNEILLGRALDGRRDRVVIATKFGFHIEGGTSDGTDSRPAHIEKVVEEQLKRLRTDRIDLLYQHRVDPAVPMEDVAGTVAKLIQAGKVRYFGLSECGVASLRRAHAVCPVSAVQSEFSLWERNLEDDVLPAMRALGVGLVAFSPLGRGFLTGQVRRAEEYEEGDYRRLDPRYQGSNYDANMAAVATVRAIAGRHRTTAAQVALAWVLAQGGDVVPIPGTKRADRLTENVGAADVVLTADDLAALDAALPPGGTAGPRYGARMMAMVDRAP